jgi:hypothetical protein
MSMRKSLWKDFGGEPFLINPHLIIANPRKRRSMASSKRRHHRRNPRRHHRRNAPKMRARSNRPRRNFMVPGFIPNPHRRRRHGALGNPRRRHRHHFNPRRNPAVLGLELPPMETTLAAAAGFILPAVLETYIMPMLPASMAGTVWGTWLVRGGIVIGAGMLARKFDRQIGNAVLIGGGVYLLTRAIAQFAPGMIPGLSSYTLGYYPPQRYIATQPRRNLSAYGGSGLLSTAGRLSPQGRYGA